MRRSFQRSLREVAFDPLVQRLAVLASEEQIGSLARHLVAADPFGEVRFLRRALELICPGVSIDPARWIEHQLWCAWREAHWKSGSTGMHLELQTENERYLRETEGYPTILIAPMTLCMTDAVRTVRAILGERSQVFYGEEIGSLTTGESAPAGGPPSETVAAVRQIRKTLDAGGVLCTYPDFVYEGHPIRRVELFGTSRPISSSFLSIATRDNTMLLPVILLRDAEALKMHFEEPIRVQTDGVVFRGKEKQLMLNSVGQSIADLLETMIRIAPHQWALLATLTFDSPQMAIR